MYKILTFLLGLLIPLSTVFTQISNEDLDKLLFEWEFGNRDSITALQRPATSRLKSGKAEIGNPPDWNWIRTFGGSGGAFISDLIADGSGNVYAVGTFSDTMKIESTTYVSKGLRDGFVIKFGSFGQLVWCIQFEADINRSVYGAVITRSSTGDIYIMGALNSENITGGGKLATRTEDEPSYMARISNDGTVDWIKVSDASGGFSKMEFGLDDHIYVIGGGGILHKFDTLGNDEKQYNEFEITDFTFGDTTIWVAGGLNNFNGYPIGDSVFYSYMYGAAFIVAELNSGLIPGRILQMETDYFHGSYYWPFIEIDSEGNLYLSGTVYKDFYIHDEVINTSYVSGFMMKLDSTLDMDWVLVQNIPERQDITEFYRKNDNAFYVYGYFPGDSVSMGSITEFPGHTGGYYSAEIDSNGNVIEINTYENWFENLYFSGSYLYHTTTIDYDDYIFKKNIAGSDYWDDIKIVSTYAAASIWYTLDIDEDGNLYAQGYFNGKVRLLGEQLLGSGLFFMKFTNDGTVEWIRAMEAPNVTSSGIKADAGQNVYAWGDFSGTIKIEDLELTADEGENNIYFIKFDKDGELKFLKQFECNGDVVGTGGIDTDPENNIIITGVFTGTLKFANYTLVSNGNRDAFIVKIDPQGNVLWARSYGGPGTDWSRGVAIDSAGYVYFTGAYQASISFDSTVFEDHTGYFDFYLTKLDPNGNVVWAKNGSSGNIYTRGHSIALEGDQVYVQGIAYYEGPYTFEDQELNSEFENNSFLINYNTDGTLEWAKLLKVNLWSWPMYGIDTDDNLNVYIGGQFQDTLVIKSTIIEGSGSRDYYIAKFDTDGNLIWLTASEQSSTAQVDFFCLATFEEDVVVTGGRVWNGVTQIGSQEIANASTGSFTGLIGEAITGCDMDLMLDVTDADQNVANGSATLSIMGGTSPYEILWSSGQSDTLQIDSLEAGTYQVTVLDSKGCEQYGVFSVNVKDGPVITIDSIGNVSCHGYNDGFIDIMVSGGTAPYTFNWSNGYRTEDITNLEAAPYEVKVTDANGISVFAGFQVSQPKQLDVSYILDEASCGGVSDGSIDVYTSGGTKPYEFLWSTGHTTQSLSGRNAGKYTFNVTDDNGCQLSLDIALSEEDAPIVETEFTVDASCGSSDGSAQVRVINAIGAITYSWSNGSSTNTISGVKAGKYFVEVANQEGCKAVHSVSIVDEQPLTNPICLVTVDTVTGKNLVVWEKVDNAITYRIYRETSQKDVYLLAGEIAGANLSVFTDSIADPTIRSYRYKIAALDECGNESYLSTLHKTVHLTMNQGITANTVNLIWDDYKGTDFSTFEVWRWSSLFSWEKLDDLPSNLTSYTDPAVPEGQVWYSVRVPLLGVCAPTGLETKAGAGPYHHSLSNLDGNRQQSTEVQSLTVDRFYAYPNPSTGLFTLWSEDFMITDGEVYITDLSGRLVLHREFRHNVSGRLTLDLSHQSAGSYIIQLKTENHLYYQKLVIQ